MRLADEEDDAEDDDKTTDEADDAEVEDNDEEMVAGRVVTSFISISFEPTLPSL